MEDTLIVELYWQRDESAIKHTAEKYGDYCMKISRNILVDISDSEENVNDTYIKTWLSIPPARPERLIAYVGRLARNLALNRYKARHAQKRGEGVRTLSLEELGDCTPLSVAAEDSEGIKHLSREISDFLGGESTDARNAFVLRYFYCESVEGIAQRLGFTQSKIKSMLKRTRDRLKLKLREEGYDV